MVGVGSPKERIDQLASARRAPWLDALSAAATAADIRTGLVHHTPAADPARLTRVAVLGAAGEGERLVGLLSRYGVTVEALVDDNPARLGTSVGTIVVAPSSTFDQLDTSIPIVIASHRTTGAAKRLKAAGFATVVPFAFLQAVDPARFPPHMFYDGIVETLIADRRQILEFADLLADAESVRVLDAVIGYRMTFDPLALDPVNDDANCYYPAGIISLGDDEVYVDAGTFDGDSIRAFIGRVGGRYDRVIGFEPDPTTFEQLSANFRDEPRVEPINKGLHRRPGVLRFRNDSSRGAIFVDDGDIEIPVTNLDTVLGGGRATYVKMNIEGSEIDAIWGAEQTIRKWRPRLAISAYHRPSDLWRIADLLRNLEPSYRFHLRQHDGGIIETVLYACS